MDSSEELPENIVPPENIAQKKKPSIFGRFFGRKHKVETLVMPNTTSVSSLSEGSQNPVVEVEKTSEEIKAELLAKINNVFEIKKRLEEAQLNLSNTPYLSGHPNFNEFADPVRQITAELRQQSAALIQEMADSREQLGDYCAIVEGKDSQGSPKRAVVLLAPVYWDMKLNVFPQTNLLNHSEGIVGRDRIAPDNMLYRSSKRVEEIYLLNEDGPYVMRRTARIEREVPEGKNLEYGYQSSINAQDSILDRDFVFSGGTTTKLYELINNSPETDLNLKNRILGLYNSDLNIPDSPRELGNQIYQSRVFNPNVEFGWDIHYADGFSPVINAEDFVRAFDMSIDGARGYQGQERLTGEKHLNFYNQLYLEPKRRY